MAFYTQFLILPQKNLSATFHRGINQQSKRMFRYLKEFQSPDKRGGLHFEACYL
jgi:hypothetical protein